MFPQIQVPTCEQQQLLHQPVNIVQGLTAQPIQGLIPQPMDINSIQGPVQQPVDMNQNSLHEQPTNHSRDEQLIPTYSANLKGPLRDTYHSSDDSNEDDSLMQLRSNHVHLLNSMPDEGINLNTKQFQFAEPISTAISLQIPHKIKRKNMLKPIYYPLAQQSCGGDIGSVPYVCM